MPSIFAPAAPLPRCPVDVYDFIELLPPAPGEHGPIGVRIEVSEAGAILRRPIQGPAPAGPLHFETQLALPDNAEAFLVVPGWCRGGAGPATEGAATFRLWKP